MSDMVGLPFPSDPSERFNEVLSCGCERAQGTDFLCVQHQFEQQVEEALGASLAVPRDGESYTGFYRRAMDLLAPRVAAAIDTALYGSELEEHYRQKALAALRGGT